MKTIIQNTMRDGGNIVVTTQFLFPADEFTAAEAETIVKGFQAPAPKPAANVSPLQAKINKQMGLPDNIFAKYADR